MRIDQLPDLPEDAEGAKVPCTYNGADYKAPLTGSGSKDGFVYNAGDVIKATVFGFGFVTTDSMQLTMVLPMPKTFYAGATITPTQISVSMRTVNGGYVGKKIYADLTGIYASSTCNGYILTIVLMDSKALEYGSEGASRGIITNNTPTTGYIYLEANVN